MCPWQGETRRGRQPAGRECREKQGRNFVRPGYVRMCRHSDSGVFRRCTTSEATGWSR